VIIVYLIFSFQAIKSERTLAVRLINNLRAKWFRLSLEKVGDERLEDKSWLIAKISYHLPLFSMGLANSFLGFIRWLLLFFVLLLICLIYGLASLWLLGLAVLMSVLVFGIAYFVSKNYVSKETTFYSKIIRLIDFSLSDWRFIKFFSRESKTLEDFDRLVDLDSYFRVRRDLWLRFGASLVFVLVIVLGGLASLSGIRGLAFLSENSLDQKFIFAIFFLYFSRLLREGLKVGLYLPPLLLGMLLSIPVRSPKKFFKKHFFQAPQLVFKSAKVKFYPKAKYHKNLNFSFSKGGRYLIFGERRTGKTSLAKLFTGQGEYGKRAWLIKVSDRRFFYHDFFDRFSGFYFIDPKFFSVRTILEVITGQERARISPEQLSSVAELVREKGLLADLFFEREDWRQSAEKLLRNTKGGLLLQVIYCLVNRPGLIAVDNYWLEQDDQEFERLLKLLASELPNSVIVYFSRTKNQLLDFQEVYEI
jgi:ABC-type multidrug transport system fused ATPase/permease subunit